MSKQKQKKNSTSMWGQVRRLLLLTRSSFAFRTLWLLSLHRPRQCRRSYTPLFKDLFCLGVSPIEVSYVCWDEFRNLLRTDTYSFYSKSLGSLSFSTCRLFWLVFRGPRPSCSRRNLPELLVESRTIRGVWKVTWGSSQCRTLILGIGYWF